MNDHSKHQKEDYHNTPGTSGGATTPPSLLLPKYPGFYCIEREAAGAVLVTVHAMLPASWQHRRLTPINVHSPTGLEYGYGGSGPSDLALTILQDFFQEPRARVIEGCNSWAWRLHQSFKWKAIATLSQKVTRHVLTLRQIAGILTRIANENPSLLLEGALGGPSLHTALSNVAHPSATTHEI